MDIVISLQKDYFTFPAAQKLQRGDHEVGTQDEGGQLTVYELWLALV